MTSAYLHGSDPEEQERLARQHRYVGGIRFLPELAAGMSALDVGCGPGLVLCDIAPLLAPGRAVGIDSASPQIEAASRRAAQQKLANVELHVGQAASLPFADGTFDLAYCRVLLEHVADPVGVLTEMARVTRPGGLVVACECLIGCCSHSDPATPAAERAFAALYELQRLRGQTPDVASELEGLFAAAGLVEVEADALEACLEEPEDIRGYALGGATLLRASEADLLSEGLLSQSELSAALADYERLCASDGARAFFNLRRVRAIRS